MEKYQVHPIDLEAKQGWHIIVFKIDWEFRNSILLFTLWRNKSITKKYKSISK
jgi:hypothetical protein